RDVAGEFPERLIAGDEVRLAVDLNQCSLVSGGVEIALNDALADLPGAALCRLRLSLHPEDLNCLLNFAAGLGERGLAVHHPRARAVAERLHIARADLSHLWRAPQSRARAHPPRRPPAPRPPAEPPPRPPCAPVPRARGAPALRARGARLPPRLGSGRAARPPRHRSPR